MGIIRISELPLEVRIGTLPEERVTAQTVHLDIELRTDMALASGSDRLDDTINYIDLVDAIRRVASGERFHLVEAMATRILDAIEAFRGVDWVRIRIRKSRLPGMGGARFIEIEQERGSP